MRNITYYFIINKPKYKKWIIGYTTLGNSFLAEEGWILLQQMVVDAENDYQLEQWVQHKQIEIKDDQNNVYSIMQFLEKIENYNFIVS
jgi:hypothetical protein